MKIGRSLGVGAAAGALLLTFPGVLPGAAALADEPLVAIHVGTVLASSSAKPGDATLGAMQSQLERMFRYRSYRLVRRQTRTAGFGRPARFRLPGNRTLVVVPESMEDQQHVVLKVMLDEGGRRLIDSELSVAADGQVLLGGPEHAGGVLIISIGARPIAAATAWAGDTVGQAGGKAK